MSTVTLPVEEYRALKADAQRWRTHTADSHGLCPFRDAAIWRRDIGHYLWTNLPELALMTENPLTRDALRELWLAWQDAADEKAFALTARAMRASWAKAWPRGDRRGAAPASNDEHIYPRPRLFNPDEQRRASILLDIALGAYDPDDVDRACYACGHQETHLEVAT